MDFVDKADFLRPNYTHIHTHASTHTHTHTHTHTQYYNKFHVPSIKIHMYT